MSNSEKSLVLACCITNFQTRNSFVRGCLRIEKSEKQNQEFEMKLILCVKDVSKLNCNMVLESQTKRCVVQASV